MHIYSWIQWTGVVVIDTTHCQRRCQWHWKEGRWSWAKIWITSRSNCRWEWLELKERARRSSTRVLSAWTCSFWLKVKSSLCIWLLIRVLQWWSPNSGWSWWKKESAHFFRPVIFPTWTSCFRSKRLQWSGFCTKQWTSILPGTQTTSQRLRERSRKESTGIRTDIQDINWSSNIR